MKVQTWFKDFSLEKTHLNKSGSWKKGNSSTTTFIINKQIFWKKNWRMNDTLFKQRSISCSFLNVLNSVFQRWLHVELNQSWPKRLSKFLPQDEDKDNRMDLAAFLLYFCLSVPLLKGRTPIFPPKSPASRQPAAFLERDAGSWWLDHNAQQELLQVTEAEVRRVHRESSQALNAPHGSKLQPAGCTRNMQLIPAGCTPALRLNYLFSRNIVRIRFCFSLLMERRSHHLRWP